MPNGARLAAGTRTGDGLIARHDCSRCGLWTLRVDLGNKYPDVGAWSAALGDGVDLIAHYYDEEDQPGRLLGRLWIYYKKR